MSLPLMRPTLKHNDMERGVGGAKWLAIFSTVGAASTQWVQSQGKWGGRGEEEKRDKGSPLIGSGGIYWFCGHFNTLLFL